MPYCTLQDDGKTIAQVCFGHQPNGSIEITDDVANSPEDYLYQNNQFVYTPNLAPRKQAKIVELLVKRDETINSQFTSATTGHTYYWDPVSQYKFHGQVTLLNLDSTIATVDWLTVDAGMVTHQRADFIKVFQESGQFERDQHTKFYQLEAQVNDPTTDTPDKINAITW